MDAPRVPPPGAYLLRGKSGGMTNCVSFSEVSKTRFEIIRNEKSYYAFNFFSLPDNLIYSNQTPYHFKLIEYACAIINCMLFS